VSLVWIVGLIFSIYADRETTQANERLQLVQTTAVQLVNESIPEQEKGTYSCTHVLVENESTTGTFDAVAYYDDGDTLPIVIRVDGERMEIAPAVPSPQAE
jgi:hypothetical protein